MLFSFSHPGNGVVTPLFFSSRLSLPWRKFSFYFHYSLGTVLIPVSFYPGDHSDPHFTIQWSLDTSWTISYHRMTFFHLLLFYFCHVIEMSFTLNTAASAPPCLGLLYAQGLTSYLTPKSLVCVHTSYLEYIVKIIETEIRMVVARNWGGEKRELWFNGYRVSVLQEEKSSGDGGW